MNGLEFIADLVDALAWPAAVVAAVFVLRKPLRAMLDRQVTRFRAGPVELEWEAEVEKIEAAVEQVEQETGTVTLDDRAVEPPTGYFTRDLWPVLDASPEAAILAAWARFESDLRGRLAAQVASARRVSMRHLLERAAKAGIMPDGLAVAGQEAQRLRNLVAGGNIEVTRDDAADFLALLDRIDAALTADSMKRHPSNRPPPGEPHDPPPP